MSDLVEKVARAMVTSKDGWPDADAGGCKVWQMYETEARAAIAAVAEWGHQNFYDDKPLHEFLAELSAALRAAADGGEK